MAAASASVNIQANWKGSDQASQQQLDLNNVWLKATLRLLPMCECIGEQLSVVVVSAAVRLFRRRKLNERISTLTTITSATRRLHCTQRAKLHEPIYVWIWVDVMECTVQHRGGPLLAQHNPYANDHTANTSKHTYDGKHWGGSRSKRKNKADTFSVWRTKRFVAYMFLTSTLTIPTCIWYTRSPHSHADTTQTHN